MIAGIEDFRAWPKAELHCHLDGALRPGTAEELADSLELDLPRPLRLVAPGQCASQADYLTFFADPIAVLQTEAALERAARELGEDSAADGVEYLEVRWAPRLHVARGLEVDRVIEAVLRGLAAAPLRTAAIVCAMRHHQVEDNVALARTAGRFAGRGVAMGCGDFGQVLPVARGQVSDVLPFVLDLLAEAGQLVIGGQRAVDTVPDAVGHAQSVPERG